MRWDTKKSDMNKVTKIKIRFITPLNFDYLFSVATHGCTSRPLSRLLQTRNIHNQQFLWCEERGRSYVVAKGKGVTNTIWFLIRKGNGNDGIFTFYGSGSGLCYYYLSAKITKSKWSLREKNCLNKQKIKANCNITNWAKTYSRNPYSNGKKG